MLKLFESFLYFLILLYLIVLIFEIGLKEGFKKGTKVKRLKSRIDLVNYQPGGLK